MELSSSYVLSDCNAVDAGYQCLSTCDSVWFKIDNKTEADYYVKYCDPIFQVKYGDITWDLKIGNIIVPVPWILLVLLFNRLAKQLLKSLR